MEGLWVAGCGWRCAGRPSSAHTPCCPAVPSGCQAVYHQFSTEELETAGATAARRAGVPAVGGRGWRRAAARPADGDVPASRAVDYLQGGLLIVRPRKAAGLPRAASWRRVLGLKADWVVRVVATGQCGEAGAVRAGSHPAFFEPVELPLAASDLVRDVDHLVRIQARGRRGARGEWRAARPPAHPARAAARLASPAHGVGLPQLPTQPPIRPPTLPGVGCPL